MSADFLLIARIILVIVSAIIIVSISILKKQNRTGNQFFVIMVSFWFGVLIIGLKPEILDSVLNTTGLVNRSQFLLSVSLALIIYLLYFQTLKSKRASLNLNQAIRRVALSNFKRELKNSNGDKAYLLIIIVAKDESENIGKVIESIKSLNFPYSYKILVVNDGSTDNTEEIARSKGVMVINHVYNLGIGSSTKTGFLASRLFKPEIVINIDADGQHDPKYIPEIVSKIKNENVDLVIASRFADESDYKTTAVRSAGNKFYTRLINQIAKISISDVTSGYRGIKFDKLNSIYFIAETNFAIETTIRAGKNGLKIMEIPVISKSREYGKSQFHRIENFLVYNWNALVQIFNALYRKVELYKNHMRLEK